MMPRRNNNIAIMGKAYLYVNKKESAYAIRIVPKTSKMATFKNRYE
jgi:hypothetical protein